MKYSVKDFRAAGLEAKWGKTSRGAPFIFARDPKATTKHQREKWWLIDGAAFKTMQEVGIREGFNQHTLLGDFFSIAA